MELAIEALSLSPDYALIDGNRDHGKTAAITLPHETVVGGDGRSVSIAAASILAKVTRDRYVTQVLDREYPQYLFAQHKGYGTKLHYAMLDQYGPCPEHRQSCREMGCGRGFHCRFGEIDLIARKDGVLCFVEVKTRTNLSCGLPREYVTPKKQERLRKTAAWYLMVKDLDCPARFDVAEVYAEGPHPQKASRIEYMENAC